MSAVTQVHLNDHIRCCEFISVFPFYMFNRVKFSCLCSRSVFMVVYFLNTYIMLLPPYFRPFYVCCSSTLVLLGAFAKLRNATIIFFFPVYSHEATRLRLDGFSWYLNSFLKFVKKIKVSLKSGKGYTRLIMFPSVILRMRNVSDKIYRDT
jgi:hypothetical protein